MNSSTDRDISCRVTRTLLLYVREANKGTLGGLLDGLELDEAYLNDTNNWVSHAFLQTLYHRMIAILGDDHAVYHMALASDRLHSLGLLDRIVKLLGSPRLIYTQAPRYNRLLKLNGDVVIHESGANHVVLEDRYHAGCPKTRYDCHYTRGILEGIPTLFHLPPARVEEIQCQVAPGAYGTRIWPDRPDYGAGGCLYRVCWDNGHRALPLWKRLFWRRAVYKQAIEDLQDAHRTVQAKYEEVKKLAADLEAANAQLRQSKHELEQKAEALVASERRYRLLAENVTDVIWTFNLATMTFTYVSPSVEHLRGLTPDEAVAMSLEQTLSPASLELVTRILAEELALEDTPGIDPNRSRTVEIQNSRKDGSWRWVEAKVSFVRDRQGRAVGLLGISRDIAARRQAEAQRARLEKALAQTRRLRAIGTLAAGVAHDFNNILMGIQGRVSLMLLDADNSQKFFKHLKAIEANVHNAALLTGKLLGFARVEKYAVMPTDLNQLAQKCAEQFQRDHNQIAVVTRLQEGIWPVDVDRVQIQQVLLDLYGNAGQAMPEGGTLTLQTVNAMVDDPFAQAHGLGAGPHVRIDVTDTGHGMDEKTLQRVFEPFFTTKAMGRGAGLGLASAHGIIGNHGGVLTARSTPGEGSTFSIYLPAGTDRER